MTKKYRKSAAQLFKEGLLHHISTPRIDHVLKHGTIVRLGARTYMELKRNPGRFGVPSTIRLRLT